MPSRIRMAMQLKKSAWFCRKNSCERMGGLFTAALGRFLGTAIFIKGMENNFRKNGRLKNKISSFGLAVDCSSFSRKKANRLP